MSLLDYGAQDVGKALPSSGAEQLPDWLQRLVDSGEATPPSRPRVKGEFPPSLGWNLEIDSTTILLADRHRLERA